MLATNHSMSSHAVLMFIAITSHISLDTYLLTYTKHFCPSTSLNLPPVVQQHVLNLIFLNRKQNNTTDHQLRVPKSSFLGAPCLLENLHYNLPHKILQLWVLEVRCMQVYMRWKDEI